MRLCTYIVKKDSGLAPNPYWGWCTLAVCTPNHQPARLEEGDWIAGFLNKRRGRKFLYAMELCEDPLNMDDYFHRADFQVKKPDLSGDWMQRCGDNFYSRKPDRTWQQHRNRYHIGPVYLALDTKNPIVFVGKSFWYLGTSAVNVPSHLSELTPIGRGIRTKHDSRLVQQFCDWVRCSFEPGIHGLPHDNLDL